MSLDWTRLRKEVAAPVPETQMAVVELLTELSTAPDAEKCLILSMLRQAAFGTRTQHAVPERFDVVSGFGEAGRKLKGPSLWWREAYDTVSRGVPDPVLAELKNPNISVVNEALALVIHFPQHASKVLPMLRAATPPPSPAAHVAIAMIAGRDALAESHAALARAPSEERRFLAALSCAIAATAGTGLTLPVPDSALAVLLGQPPLTTVAFPFSTLPGAVARTMAKLGRTTSTLAGRIVASAPAWFPSEKSEGEKPFLTMLLELAFPSRAEHLPGQGPSSAQALSTLQRNTLVAIVDHPGWKAPGAADVNQAHSLAWHLARRALPRDVPSLRAFLYGP